MKVCRQLLELFELVDASQSFADGWSVNAIDARGGFHITHPGSEPDLWFPAFPLSRLTHDDPPMG